MPRKLRNRIITRCSSNVNVAISVSKTLLQLDLVRSIQQVVQCCHLASPNLKNSHVSSNNFHVSICFHFREKNRIPYNLNAPRNYQNILYVVKYVSVVAGAILHLFNIYFYDGSVGLVSHYWLEDPVFETRWGKEIFLVSKTSRQALGAHPATISVCTGFISPV